MASTPEIAAPALRRARQHLLEHGQCPDGMLDESLARSWRRSLAAGLLPVGRLHDGEYLSGGELRRSLVRNHELLAHSDPVMEYLFEQVRHSHSMVILADSQGVLMHTLGEADFLNRAERVALAAGASWHEQWRGTNAIGTALAENASVEIHGPEHFLERNGFLTCAASPIVGATGRLVGVLDISGDQRSRHPHTLGLVGTAARMIENRLVTAACRRNIRLHLHARAEGIGTVAEGIVALAEDGWIVGANRIGLRLLGLAPADLGATPLMRVLSTRFEELLSWQRRRGDQPIQVRCQDGTMLFAQVHAGTPSLGASARTLAPAAETDALAQLDTGDARWRAAADKARRVLDKPIPLLLCGESGVGKELFARACHDAGPRRERPFVAINCAALPENLIEAELFGYAPGAFTGARKDGSIGRLREAHGGTLFLDEIGDMPLAMQTRLLRVLQERQVTPLGGGQPVDVDFALICATHCNLRQAVDRGHFRTDLYYRINGLTLLLPSLRERTDLQALTERLLAELAPGRPLTVSADLLRRFASHSGPGNLRQYASLLRTAVAMLDDDESVIDWPHLPDDFAEELVATPPASASPAVIADGGSLAEVSRSAIQRALEVSRGNVSAAARLLGVSRQTLYRKLRARAAKD